MIDAHLVDIKKTYLPPFLYQIKFNDKFCEGMGRNKRSSLYLQEMLSTITDAKIKECISIGSQIKELIKGENVERLLNDLDKCTLILFKNVVTQCLGNNKSDN